MVIAYRNDEDVLQARLGSLLEARSVEVASVSADLRDVYAGRVARVVAGGVASLGGAALMVGGLVRSSAGSGGWLNMNGRDGDGSLVGILCGSVLAGALAWAPAKACARAFVDRALARSPSLSGNVRVDLVRVERANPRRLLGAMIGKLEASSAALPLVAAALLAPLALHLIVWLLCGSPSAQHGIGGFDAWIALSVPLVGFAHLILALLGFLFARKLHEKSTEELVNKPSSEGWKALGFTALAGAVPGVVLFLIPPILVGLTGLMFIPLSFGAVSRAVARERRIIDAVGE